MGEYIEYLEKGRINNQAEKEFLGKEVFTVLRTCCWKR